MLRKTFSSSDETETDVDDNQSENSFPIVSVEVWRADESANQLTRLKSHVQSYLQMEPVCLQVFVPTNRDPHLFNQLTLAFDQLFNVETCRNTGRLWVNVHSCLSTVSRNVSSDQRSCLSPLPEL